MSKTIVLNEVQERALRFVIGGRHQLQMEPAHKDALGDVEYQLNAPSDAVPEEGTVSPPAKKAKRGRK